MQYYNMWTSSEVVFCICVCNVSILSCTIYARYIYNTFSYYNDEDLNRIVEYI